MKYLKLYEKFNAFQPKVRDNYDIIKSQIIKKVKNFADLIISKEMLGSQIASIHNLSFYIWLVGEARKHIIEGDFSNWKDMMVKKVTTRL